MENKVENISEILKWYSLAGVDEICADSPQNILAVGADHTISAEVKRRQDITRVAQENAAAVRPATTLLAQSNSEALNNAREACRNADSLEQLQQILSGFEGCSLKFSANSTVFGYGNPKAEVMVIGEAPGAEEDRLGKPFVGRSGQLLDKMLASIGLNREENCYITNVLPWRPPGNRTPTDAEVAVCLPFLRRQIELVNPRIIFLLGASAANAVLDNTDSISNLRGKFIDYTTDTGIVIPTLSSFHPAFLLRSAAQKAKAWSDLLRLRRKLYGK